MKRMDEKQVRKLVSKIVCNLTDISNTRPLAGTTKKIIDEAFEEIPDSTYKNIEYALEQLPMTWYPGLLAHLLKQTVGMSIFPNDNPIPFIQKNIIGKLDIKHSESVPDSENEQDWHVYGIMAGTRYIGRVNAPDEKTAKEKAWGLEKVSKVALNEMLCEKCREETDDLVYVDLAVMRKKEDKDTKLP